MRREVSWSAVLVVVASVAVTSFSGYLLATWPPEPPASTLPVQSATSSPPSAPSPSDGPTINRTGESRVVAVLGGSFSRVSPGPGESWPQIVADRLGWTLADQSVDGSGYLAGKPFGSRVQEVLYAAPDVIVVAGGERDLGRPLPEVAAAAEDVISRLTAGAPDARIVVLSPFSHGEPGPLTNQFSSDLRAIAQANQVEYVDATRWLTGGTGDFVAADGVHPTESGQRRIAQRLEKALTRLGVADPSPTD